MRERQPIHIEIAGEEDFEKYDLVNYLGNRNNSTRQGWVREDLRSWSSRYVKRHIVHHIEHDWQNPHGKKWVKRVNETKALFFPGLRDPLGLVVAVVDKRKLSKLNRSK